MSCREHRVPNVLMFSMEMDSTSWFGVVFSPCRASTVAEYDLLYTIHFRARLNRYMRLFFGVVTANVASVQDVF